MKKNRISTLIFVLVAIGISGFFYKRYHVPPAIDVPAIDLTDMTGHKVLLSAYNGHPLFISFFATWCGPCIRELPELADFKNKFSDKEMQIICISDEPVDKLKRVLAYTGNQLIILHSDQPLHDMGIYTYPTNYIYDAKGQKVYEHTNSDNWKNPELIARIRGLLH